MHQYLLLIEENKSSGLRNVGINRDTIYNPNICGFQILKDFNKFPFRNQKYELRGKKPHQHIEPMRMSYDM